MIKLVVNHLRIRMVRWSWPRCFIIPWLWWPWSRCVSVPECLVLIMTQMYRYSLLAALVVTQMSVFLSGCDSRDPDVSVHVFLNGCVGRAPWQVNVWLDVCDPERTQQHPNFTLKLPSSTACPDKSVFWLLTFFSRIHSSILSHRFCVVKEPSLCKTGISYVFLNKLNWTVLICGIELFFMIKAS